jgi:hypothetical protein
MIRRWVILNHTILSHLIPQQEVSILLVSPLPSYLMANRELVISSDALPHLGDFMSCSTECKWCIIFHQIVTGHHIDSHSNRRWVGYVSWLLFQVFIQHLWIIESECYYYIRAITLTSTTPMANREWVQVQTLFWEVIILVLAWTTQDVSDTVVFCEVVSTHSQQFVSYTVCSEPICLMLFFLFHH